MEIRDSCDIGQFCGQIQKSCDNCTERKKKWVAVDDVLEYLKVMQDFGYDNIGIENLVKLLTYEGMVRDE